jgi:OTT_1508-like deaminase
LPLRKKRKDTPKNVTATALIQKESTRFIYIAKNDGLSQADRQCAEWIEEWFGLKQSQHSNSGCHNSYWLKLLAHWNDRVRHYSKMVRNVDIQEIEASQNEIREYFQDEIEDFSQDSFNDEWKHVIEVLNLIHKNFDDRSDQKDCETEHSKQERDDLWDDLYSFWQRSSLQIYPSERSRESQQERAPTPREIAANKYSRCVYHLEMLAMPVSIWKAMRDFREIKGKDKVQIVLIEGSSENSHLDVEQVRTTLNSWKRGYGTEAEEVSKALLNATPGTKRLGQAVYLHCEMQILLLFHQLRDDKRLKKHNFIGCSKLSCHMCWEVLKNRKHLATRTRGTHGKVSANWAFTFPQDLPEMVDMLKRLHLEWDSRFKKHKDRNFPGWPLQLDTAPARTEKNDFSKVSCESSAEVS